ncbi:unnamed protein product [Allacma fusca]|uniref:Uncharacterized protein n=1 Tax=Allacma fusca TaxID=39272 RepID=A0A8J2KMN0_9HEXA|nr:unnamed protein product [Allacma fusca]
MSVKFCILFLSILATTGVLAQNASPTERYWWRKGNWTTNWDPNNAVIAGHQDENQVGTTLVYICRANHDGQKIPGTYLPDINQCAVTYQGSEIMFPDGFETLKEDSPNAFNWLESSHGQLVNGSVVAGFSSNFEPFFICRARIEDLQKNAVVLYAGKLQPTTRVCSIPWAGSEKSIDKYEVLQDPEYAPVEDVKYQR